MNSSSIGSGGAGALPVKTEFANDVKTVQHNTVTREESFGEKLNRMSGVVVPGKTKYGAKDEALSKEAFLKMTMEQIKYQDPMDPVKNDQFTQQMAALSQLEQQVNMNSTLKGILDNSKNMQIAALQLVGKDISADSSMIYHDGAVATAFQFNLPKAVTELKVEILNENGEAIDTMDLGAREGGAITTKWDGIMANDVPALAGKYAYRVVAKGADGNSVDVPTKIEGRVNGVTTSKGTTFLLVGEQKVAMGDVQTILEGKQPQMAAVADRNSAGTESVIGNVGSDAGVKETTVEEKPRAKPQIAVSEGAESSLKGDSEVSSLFPLLYR